MLSTLLALGQVCAVCAEDAPFPIASSSATIIQEDGTVITSDGTDSAGGVEDAASSDDGTYAGTLEDNGLTPEEYIADYYLENLQKSNLQTLKNISEWPSEDMIKAIENTDIPDAADLWVKAHSLTSPSSALDQKMEAYYEAMIVKLLVDSSELIDWSELEDLTDPASDDNDTVQSVLNTLGEETKVSSLTEEEKESLKQELNEAIPELPATLIDKTLSIGGTVKDCVKRIDKYKALSKIGGEARTVLLEMKNHTVDLDLKMAIDGVISAMDSSSDGFWESLIMSGIDLSKKEISKAIDAAYSDLMTAMPPLSYFYVGLEIGTAVSDILTSSFFDTDGNIAAYIQLECLGEMARALNKASESFGQKYQSEKGGSDVMRRRVDAQAFNWSIRALCDLNLLSFDYTKQWAQQSTDHTWFQKWVTLLTNGNFGEYDQFYKKLANLKSLAVTRKYNLIIDPIVVLPLCYPDDYWFRKVDGKTMDEYLDDLYEESADKAKEAYDGILKKSSGTSSQGSTKKETEKKETEKTDPSSVLDRFLDNKAQAYNPQTGEYFYYSNISEGDWGYSGDAKNRVDLDNDGELEQILDGMYGGMYLDVRDGRVVVLATGDGTAAVLTYGYYEGKVWICHCDTTHQGRDWFHLDQYDGSGNIVDSFDLNANFFEGDLQDQYDPNDEYTFRDQNISMEQFISLVNEIFGQNDPGLILSLGLPDMDASADGSSAEGAGADSETGAETTDYLQALQSAVSCNGYASNTFASVDLSGVDETDTEDGYEFRNQTLSIPEFFDSEEAARAVLAQTDGGMDVSGPDENGKWTVMLIPDGVRLKQIYAGSIYVRKDAVVSYQNLTDGSPVTMQTSAETFRSQGQQIAGTSLCFIKSFDENGYVTELEAMQFNMMIPEG